MGSGPSESPDPKKVLPQRLTTDQPLEPELERSADARDSTGGGGGSEGSFCERLQLVEFRATQTIQSGVMIRLTVGRPPSVRTTSGQLVGELIGQSAAAMRHCLELEYAMEGKIPTQVAAGESGKVAVKGIRL
jgi:hypothetical protein